MKCALENCEAKNSVGRPAQITTLKGWKIHMNRYHGGWTEDQLRAASGAGNEGAALSGEAGFGEMKEKMPEDAAAFSSEKPAPDAQADSSTTRTRKVRADKAVKRMRATIAQIPVKLFDGLAEAKKDDRWKLSAQENEVISDAIDCALDILSPEVEVEAIGFTIRNPVWFLVYPLAVLAVLFGMRQAIYGQETTENA